MEKPILGANQVKHTLYPRLHRSLTGRLHVTLTLTSPQNYFSIVLNKTILPTCHSCSYCSRCHNDVSATIAATSATTFTPVSAALTAPTAAFVSATAVAAVMAATIAAVMAATVTAATTAIQPLFG
jgi:hypothetical protein